MLFGPGAITEAKKKGESGSKDSILSQEDGKAMHVSLKHRNRQNQYSTSTLKELIS